MKEKNLRREIVKVCKRLHRKGFLAAADGNVSYRLNDDLLLITPSGVAKRDVKEDELAEVSLQGEVLHGEPSTELSMHLTVYQNCPEAKAVVHAHPPYAIAWSIARPELTCLPAESMSELILAVGDIPLVPYARPGTPAMGDHLLPLLPEYRAMILSRHGALSWGEDLQEAYNGMERLEHAAQVLAIARQLGGLTSLPEEEVRYLREVRKKKGHRTS